MSAEAEVLVANQAFYDAFSAGDVAAMDALWARQAAVVCLHPGWEILRGRDTVMASWKAILESPGHPRVQPVGAQAFVYGAAALVACYERLQGGLLAATNVFVHEDGRWRLVSHQAGPAPAPSAPEPADQGTRLH